MKKVSIIILDFLKADRVVENVKSILKQKSDFELEIIVVDNSVNKENAEKLRQLEQFSNVKVLISSKNLGYPKGNNFGAKEATGDYMAIVNPDIIWRDENVLQELVTFLENNKTTGIVAPVQISEITNKPEMTVRAFPGLLSQVSRRTFLRNIWPLTRLVAYDEQQRLDYTKVQDVDWLQSSFVVMSKQFWDDVGGFDEDYFLFMADVDICRHAWEKGLKVQLYPEVKVYSDGIRCSSGGFKKFFKSWVLRQHLKDALKYYRKNFGKGNPRKLYYKKLK